MTWRTKTAVLVSLLALASCASEDAASPTRTGSRAVTQGGAQDIGRFRGIVDEGGVPEPSTLDPVGFFAEHALDLPAAECGQTICVHAMLAVAQRPGGANWTMGYVAMNTPVDPETLERPPLHVAVVAERTEATRDAWPSVLLGIDALRAGLRPGDRLTLVTYGDNARLAGRELAIDDPALDAALDDVLAPGVASAAALYDGLATGYRAVADTGSARVILISTGRADRGITDHDRLALLAAAHSRLGIGLSVIALGDGDTTLLASMTDRGAATFYQAESNADLTALLRLEGETTTFPLATSFRMQVTPARGYRLGNVYGVRRFAVGAEGAEIVVPALFLGRRTGSSDTPNGRRGGGGAIFVELLPDAVEAATVAPGEAAFTVEARWIDPVTGTEHASQAGSDNPLAPGDTPARDRSVITQDSGRKAFVMLNAYLSLRGSVDFEHAGDCARALGVLDLMTPTLSSYLVGRDDPDIEADLALMLSLRGNLMELCAAHDPVAPVFEASCGFI